MESLIKKFLKKFTNHSTENLKIRKGIKSDYSVTTEDGHKVNFWIDDKTISYGIVGWGICTSVQKSELQ